MLVIEADKGNITVGVLRNVYNRMMLHILNGVDSFQVVPNNTTASF